MRRFLSWIIAALGPAVVAAQQTTGDLGGRVLGADGTPLAEAQVVTAGPSVPRWSLTARVGFLLA